MVLENKAKIKNLETDDEISVLFNPPEYQLQKTNQFAEVGIPGLGSSTFQFVKGGAQTLTIELFFDTTNPNLLKEIDPGKTDFNKDVRFFTQKILKLMAINPKTHAPPRLLFRWGKSLTFHCILESARQRFTYFNTDGTPLRATLNVTFKGYEEIKDIVAKDATESADRAKQWIVKEGDTLQSIAAEEYGDPRQWRAIAEANHIDSPLILPLGQGLLLPALT